MPWKSKSPRGCAWIILGSRSCFVVTSMMGSNDSCRGAGGRLGQCKGGWIGLDGYAGRSPTYERSKVSGICPPSSQAFHPRLQGSGLYTRRHTLEAEGGGLPPCKLPHPHLQNVLRLLESTRGGGIALAAHEVQGVLRRGALPPSPSPGLLPVARDGRCRRCRRLGPAPSSNSSSHMVDGGCRAGRGTPQQRPLPRGDELVHALPDVRALRGAEPLALGQRVKRAAADAAQAPNVVLALTLVADDDRAVRETFLLKVRLCA